MTTHAFGARTPRELLERARFEVEELEKAVDGYFLTEHEAKNRIGSLSATCATTLWNLVDWLENSTDPTIRNACAKVGLATEKSIRKYVLENSPSLKLCWEVTNGYKHFKLKGDTLKHSQVDEAGLSAPSGLPSTEPLGHRFKPKIKTKAGRNLPALDVYKDALAYWEAFLSRVGV
jgi:hypothetical protein